MIITGGLGVEAMEGKVDHPGALVLSDLVHRDGVETKFTPRIREAKAGDPSTSGSRPSELVVDLYFQARDDDEAKSIVEDVFNADPLPASAYKVTWTPPRQ